MDHHAPIPPSSALLLQEHTPLADNSWDYLVEQSTQGSVFHRADWCRVLSETYGFKPVYLTGHENNKPSAALPLLEINSRLTGKRAVALPFTDECPALNFSNNGVEQILQAVSQLGASRGWKHVEIRGGQNLFGSEKPSLAFYGHKLNLAQRTESLFESLESSVRRAIRKAEQACLKVEFSNTPEAMATYYQLHCHTRKHHGLPPQPFQFFRKIQEHLLSKNHGIVVVARLNTQAVAAAVYLQHGSKAVYKFGASLKDVLDTRANNLVMWKAIQWLAEKGCTELTFGRTSLHHEGLRRFKLGWGTEEYAINYFKYDLKQKRVVAETDQSAGWYNTVFRHLPIPAGRLAGRLLYRHVA